MLLRILNISKMKKKNKIIMWKRRVWFRKSLSNEKNGVQHQSLKYKKKLLDFKWRSIHFRLFFFEHIRAFSTQTVFFASSLLFFNHNITQKFIFVYRETCYVLLYEQMMCRCCYLTKYKAENFHKSFTQDLQSHKNQWNFSSVEVVYTATISSVLFFSLFWLTKR